MEVNQNQTLEEKELDDKLKKEAEEELKKMQISSISGELLYTTNRQELDDCFYSILALMSWNKTFSIGKVSLTFSTISNEDKMSLLRKAQEWGKEEKASEQMFDEYMNKLNLAYYLSYIEINGNGINLKEKDLKDRLALLSMNAEDALKFYGTYVYVFQEIIRLSLLSQISLKN